MLNWKDQVLDIWHKQIILKNEILHQKQVTTHSAPWLVLNESYLIDRWVPDMNDASGNIKYFLFYGWVFKYVTEVETTSALQDKDKYFIHQYYHTTYSAARNVDIVAHTVWREENAWYKLLYGIDYYTTSGQLLSDNAIAAAKLEFQTNPATKDAAEQCQRIRSFFNNANEAESIFRDIYKIETTIFTHSFSTDFKDNYPKDAFIFKLEVIRSQIYDLWYVNRNQYISTIPFQTASAQGWLDQYNTLQDWYVIKDKRHFVYPERLPYHIGWKQQDDEWVNGVSGEHCNFSYIFKNTPVWPPIVFTEEDANYILYDIKNHQNTSDRLITVIKPLYPLLFNSDEVFTGEEVEKLCQAYLTGNIITLKTYFEKLNNYSTTQFSSQDFIYLFLPVRGYVLDTINWDTKKIIYKYSHHFQDKQGKKNYFSFIPYSNPLFMGSGMIHKDKDNKELDQQNSVSYISFHDIWDGRFFTDYTNNENYLPFYFSGFPKQDELLLSVNNENTRFISLISDTSTTEIESFSEEEGTSHVIAYWTEHDKMKSYIRVF